MKQTEYEAATDKLPTHLGQHDILQVEIAKREATRLPAPHAHISSQEAQSEMLPRQRLEGRQSGRQNHRRSLQPDGCSSTGGSGAYTPATADAQQQARGAPNLRLTEQAPSRGKRPHPSNIFSSSGRSMAVGPPMPACCLQPLAPLLCWTARLRGRAVQQRSLSAGCLVLKQQQAGHGSPTQAAAAAAARGGRQTPQRPGHRCIDRSSSAAAAFQGRRALPSLPGGRHGAPSGSSSSTAAPGTPHTCTAHIAPGCKHPGAHHPARARPSARAPALQHGNPTHSLVRCSPVQSRQREAQRKGVDELLRLAGGAA